MIRRTEDSAPFGTPPNDSATDTQPASSTVVTTEAPAPSRFRPAVNAFAGPMDLLLYLIHKDEVDIFDIPIASILDQYLSHVETLERNGLLDLVEAGEFLLMGSRLMEIKSRMLLPDFDESEDDGVLEEELEDPRLSLVEQLIEYRDIKERAVLLEDVHTQWSQRYDHPPTDLPPPPPDSLDLSKTTIWDLCAAFDRVLEEVKDHSGTHVIPVDDTPIETLIQHVTTRLEEAEGGKISFRTLFDPSLGRPTLIAHFLALLEMSRLQLLWIRQSKGSEDIELTLRVLP